MTHTNQTFSSIGTGVRFTFAAAGDSYFVSAPAIVESTNNIAIRGSHGDESVTVQGWVKSSFIALYFDGGSDIVEVGRTGGVSSSLSSISTSCIAFVGGNSTLINQGKILAEGTVGVTMAGDDNEIMNTGTIRAAVGVMIGISGSRGNTLVNSGTISSTGDHDPVPNYRSDTAVIVDGPDALVLNQRGGKLLASEQGGAGVLVETFVGTGGDGSLVENHGLIQALRGYGVDFSYMADLEIARLENYGTIKGGTGSFVGNASGEIIVNRGKMFGTVDLGAGDDVFDGDKGSVRGAILGGDGGDDIFGGNGHQSINGGTNIDVLAGGKGSDSLTGGDGTDTFVLRTGFGRDTVTDFFNGQDVIDLSRLNAIKNFDDLDRHHIEKTRA